MSIRLKLTIIFLAISLIPLVFISALTFDNYRRSLEANRLSQLQDLAAFKADKIDSYFSGLKVNIKMVQGSYNIKQNLPILDRLAGETNNPEFLAAKKTLDAQLTHFQKVLGLLDIMLVNREGKVIYSSNPEHSLENFLKPLPDPQQKAFAEGKDKIYLTDIFPSQTLSNKLEMLITAPAVDLDDSLSGVIAFEVDMAPLYKLIQDASGLGNTGETLIGKKIGNQVFYLNTLRHDPQAALKKKVYIGDKSGVPIQEAAQGKSGAGIALDYRNKKVVAAWRYIPSLDWGIVAKIDIEEAFAEVTNLRNLILLILAMVFVLSGIMAISFAQSISKPIKRLSKGAEAIGSGNLNVKLGTDGKDEVGQLSRAFDKMIRDLRQAGVSRDIERQRLYGVLETLPVYVILLSEDYRVPFANKFFRERFGDSGGKRCYEYLFKRGEPCENCETYKVMKTGTQHHWEWLGPDNRNYDIYDYPFVDADGSRMILEMGIDITEQKRAQNALRQANTYHRNLIEASLDPLVTISSEGKITDVNDATVIVTGVSRDEMIGTDFSRYFTEPEKAHDGYQLVFSKGTVKDYPLTIRHKDGRLTDVLYNASVYKDEKGNVIGIFAAARDVTLLKQVEAELRRHRDSLEVLVKERTKQLEAVNTELQLEIEERKQAQEALSSERENLQEIFNAVNIGMLLIDKKGVVKRVNNTLSIWLGRDLSSSYGKQPGDVVDCINALSNPGGCGNATQCASCPIRNTFESVLATGKAIHSVEAEAQVFVNGKEERLWLEVSVDPLVIDGQMHAIVAMNNISRRKQAEESLRQARDYLENIFNYSNAPFICWDKNFRITRFNRAFENLTDYKQGEVLGKELSMLFPVESKEESLDKIKRTLSGEHWEVVEIPIRRKDGEVRVALWNSANVYDRDGKTLLSTIAQGQDITERKQFEEELRRSNENLGQFAYVASHDLQEPLRMMASYSGLLERRYKDRLDTDANEFIGYIVDGAKRMQKLINDLLTYSRVGRTDKALEEIDCNEILGKVVNSLSALIDESRAVITNDNLPKIVGNETNFIQLFQNFISNAIKFRDENRDLYIHISVKRQSDEWVFCVRDNGIGIEPQHRERIFLIFQRLHTRDKYPGTGIGLSICKKIVEVQGGRIWVESEFGKGSAFYFTIPARRK